jgi:hypothetical protein
VKTSADLTPTFSSLTPVTVTTRAYVVPAVSVAGCGSDPAHDLT